MRATGLLTTFFGMAVLVGVACTGDDPNDNPTSSATTTSANGGTGQGGAGVGGSGNGTPGTCAAPIELSVPGSVDGDTSGAANNFDSLCGSSDGTGPEQVYAITSPLTGKLEVKLTSPAGAGTGGGGGAMGADLGISVRTQCDDTGVSDCCAGHASTGCSDMAIQQCVCAVDSFCCDTEWDSACVALVTSEGCGSCPTLECADNVISGTESLAFDATQGETYYLHVDGYDAMSAGSYTLEVAEVQPEADCNNLRDDDYDDLVDCEDATTCQTTAACTPGSSPHGGACTVHSDCVANNNDPFCANETATGYPAGFCLEFCDLMADDCGSDALCLDFGFPSGAGMCVKTCTTDANCRQPQYSCQDFGEASLLCNPETCGMTQAASLGANMGDTTDAWDTHAGSCTGGGANEQIWTFTPGSSGNLTITVNSMNDLGVYVRTTCRDENSELAMGCVDDQVGGTDEVLTVPVTQGTPYFIVVDGYAGLFGADAGPYTMTLSLQ